MIRLTNGSFIIGFDDGYQLGKTANFVFDNGVHMIGNTPPTLKENSLLYDGGYYKVGEGRLSRRTRYQMKTAGCLLWGNRKRAEKSGQETGFGYPCSRAAFFKFWPGQAEAGGLLWQKA